MEGTKDETPLRDEPPGVVWIVTDEGLTDEVVATGSLVTCKDGDAVEFVDGSTGEVLGRTVEHLLERVRPHTCDGSRPALTLSFMTTFLPDCVPWHNIVAGHIERAFLPGALCRLMDSERRLEAAAAAQRTVEELAQSVDRRMGALEERMRRMEEWIDAVAAASDVVCARCAGPAAIRDDYEQRESSHRLHPRRRQPCAIIATAAPTAAAMTETADANGGDDDGDAPLP